MSESASMRVIAVADLPWPHFLFRCHFSALFVAAVPSAVEDDVRAQYVEACARDIPPWRLRRCEYHRPNWTWAAATAIACWETGDADDALGDAAEAGRRTGESDDTILAMYSFFWEPIFISGTRLGNGQHRVCAMKLAGVLHCLIED
jgi:hypothetical protein